MPAEKFTQPDLERACDDLATMPFFPADSRASVMTALRKMCPDKEALTWLISEAVNHVSKWPGLAELRGLLCTRYTPADGRPDQWCNLPGYTAAEAEAKYLAKHEELKALPPPLKALKALEDNPQAQGAK